MSWIAGSFILKDNSKKELELAMGRIRSSVRHNADLEEFPSMGDYVMPIKRIFEHSIFPTYEDAYNACEDSQNKWGRKYNVIVAFYDNNAVKDTKKMEDIRRRIKETEQKIVECKDKNDVSNFKADYIGCPKCGSKINKRYISSSKCPLCHEDLHSKTTKETLNNYEEKIKKLKKTLKEESAKRKLPVHYLVMFEEYVG